MNDDSSNDAKEESEDDKWARLRKDRIVDDESSESA